MSPEDAERLLNALHSGSISASDLSGEQFQAIIFHRLIELCRQSEEYEYDVVDNYQGAVDFVVRERTRHISQFHTQNATHVFECKHYRRTLELSTVAKLLVFGVRFQPASLNIVSRTSLQPQVYEYARVLFNGLGNDTAMFRNTFFRHYETRDLLKLEISPDDPNERDVSEKPPKEKELDISWEIVECQPFAERTIGGSHNRDGTPVLLGRWSYRLTLWLCTGYRPEDLKMWIDNVPKIVQRDHREPKVIRMDDGRCQVRLVQILDPRRLEKPIKGNIVLHVSYKSRSHHAITIPFSAIPWTDQARYSDLRKAEVDEFVSQLQRRVAPRLLLLGGATGVGKTHFCETVAERIRVHESFDVNRFSADPETETTLLATMLTTICTPAAVRADTRNEWHELASTLVKALSPIAESDMSKQSTPGPAEVIIPVLAELLVRAGPRILILRDAHRLTERTAREFGALITRLDDLGWGEVYCIVEHRTPDTKYNSHWPDTKYNSHWKGLESKIRTRVNGCLYRHLEPLSRKEVHIFLDSVFIHITPELKDAMWNRCGGVPLYLFSVLDLLKSQRAIEYIGDGRWEIETPSTFLSSTRTNRRADGVLEERLKAISWEGTILPGAFQRNPWVLVALFAIAHERSRVQKLCHFADIEPEARRSVHRTLIRHNVINQSGSEWAFDFQHDLLRRAAIEVGRESTAAPPLVEQILKRMWNGEEGVLELELGSDLASWIGFREDSNRALNAAFERLRRSKDFALICRILEKLCEGLEGWALGSIKNHNEYLSARFALAWATWNTGSLIEAREHYARLADEVMTSANAMADDVAVAEASAADAQRRVLGIDLELEKLPDFFESARRALALNGNSIVFHSIINRLILYCAEFSHVDFGLELSRLTLQAFGDPEPESAGAVICTDIGRLFRAAAPESALLLYRQGVQLAFDPRQRLYNELDVLITEVMLGYRQLQTQEIAEWRKILCESGLREMLLRFDFFCAAMALHSRQIGQARRLLQHLETTIAVYRYESCWLPLWSNRLIAALLDGNDEELSILAGRIVTRIECLLQQRQTAIKALLDLRPAIEMQRARFSHLKPLDVLIPPCRPAYSGVLAQVLLNMHAVSKVTRGEVRDTLCKAVDLWPPDISYENALEAFSARPLTRAVEFHGANLILCGQ